MWELPGLFDEAMLLIKSVEGVVQPHASWKSVWTGVTANSLKTHRVHFRILHYPECSSFPKDIFWFEFFVLLYLAIDRNTAHGHRKGQFSRPGVISYAYWLFQVTPWRTRRSCHVWHRFASCPSLWSFVSYLSL